MIMRMQVVFPAPLGPMTPYIAPRGTTRSRSSIARVDPNVFVRLRNRRAGSTMGPSFREASTGRACRRVPIARGVHQRDATHLRPHIQTTARLAPHLLTTRSRSLKLQFLNVTFEAARATGHPRGPGGCSPPCRRSGGSVVGPPLRPADLETAAIRETLSRSQRPPPCNGRPHGTGRQ